METRAFWLQDVIDDGRLDMVKIPGEKNISDSGTKALDRERHAHLMKQMGTRN